jgi:radical SAM superfamily enzyme YgiQ (UPF0313 family)
MRVLLLYPELESFSHKALGVSLLLGLLKRDGYEARLFDSSLYDQRKILPDEAMHGKDYTPVYWFKKSPIRLEKPSTLSVDVVEAFQGLLNEFKPKVILVSTSFLSFNLGANLVSACDTGDAVVIYGGIHCTTAPEDAIAHEKVKYIHIGEAEVSLSPILDRIKNGKPIDDCKNLWVKKPSGEIVKNPIEQLMTNLDELPYYNWDHHNDFHFNRLYEGKVYRIGDYSTSRGCLNKCTYCFYRNFLDAYGYKRNFVRRYTPERIIDELAYLKERYNIDFIKFHDSDFLNMSPSYLDKFSRLYRKHIDLPNTINACVEHVLEKKARYLVRMNTRSVSVGLESGSERIRKEILNRHYTNESFIKKIAILRNHGLRVSAPCLTGLPEERREDIMETIRVCKDSKLDHADFGIFFPFPRLQLTEYAIEHGYLDRGQKVGHIAFGLESALKLDIPHNELYAIHRTAMLYLNLPFFLWPLVKLSERNTYGGTLWNLLRRIYFFKLHHLDFTGMGRRRRWENVHLADEPQI